MNPRNLRLIQAATATFALAIPTIVSAADYQWDTNGSTTGLGGTGTWDTSSLFWDQLLVGSDTGTDATTAHTFTNAEKATFGGTAGTVTLGTGITTNGLVFNTAGYTVTGNTLTLGGTNPTITANVDATIGSALQTAANIYKNGSGTLTLSGDNSSTITNGVNVTGGVLSVSNIADTGTGSQIGNFASGTSPFLGVSGNATFRYTGSTAATTARPIYVNGTVAGDGTFDITDAAGSLTLTGTNGTINRRVIKSGAGALTIYAPILKGTSSLGAVTVNAGTLTLRGTNNYTLPTLITGGTLQIDGAGTLLSTNTITNNGAFRYSSSATQTLSGVISGSGSLTKDTSSSSTLILSGANTYTGLTTISAGTLKLGATGGATNTPLGTTAAGTTISASGAALDLNGFTLGTAEALTLNGTGISSGGALTNSSATAASYSGLITLGSASSIVASSGNINLSNSNTISGSGFGLTLGGTASGSNLASIVGTGAGTLTKFGTGTWTLTGSNTYIGATTVHGGTLALGNTGSVASTSLVVGDAGSTGAVFDVTAKSGYTVASGKTLSGIGTVNAGTGNTLTIGSGATHEVGNSGTGSQSVTGDLTYSSGSIFAWDLNANSNTGAGTNYDAVAISGNLSVDGTAGTGAIFKIVLGSGVDLTNAFWSHGTTHTWNDIFSGFTGLTGGFDNTNLQVTGKSITGIGSFTISGSTLTWTAVPEPTTALAGLLLGFGLLRRRRA